MLVLISLAAIVLAMVGLGSRPVQIKIGRSPWSGVMVGHATADLPESGPARPALGMAVAIAAAKISDVVLNVCFTPRSSSGSIWAAVASGVIKPYALQPELYNGVIMTICQDDKDWSRAIVDFLTQCPVALKAARHLDRKAKR